MRRITLLTLLAALAPTAVQAAAKQTSEDVARHVTAEEQAVADMDESAVFRMLSMAFSRVTGGELGVGDGAGRRATNRRRRLEDTSAYECSGFVDSAGTAADPQCVCDGPAYYVYPCCYEQGDNTVCTENYDAADAECVLKEAMYESCYDVGSNAFEQVSPGCVLGEDITGEQYSGLTEAECIRRCNQYGFGCVAVEYGVDHGVDDDYLPGDCHLKSGTEDYETCPEHNLDLYIRHNATGYGECYTPGYVIGDDMCEGTGEDCSLEATCKTSDYYTGNAVVSCPIEGGRFKLDGCGRGGVILNAFTASAQYYVVMPFYKCTLAQVFLTAAAPASCASFAAAQGWSAFAIGNDACDEDTGTACNTDIRCKFYDGCEGNIVPSADTDLYVLTEVLGSQYDVDDTAHAFDCLAETPSKCCSRAVDQDQTAAVVALFGAQTGTLGFGGAPGFENWIACGGDTGSDGCSRISCAFWCLMLDDDCAAFFHEGHDYDLDGDDDFTICAFSSTCTLSSPSVTRPGCTGHFMDRTDNCAA
jgi:hypothetical protein